VLHQGRGRDICNAEKIKIKHIYITYAITTTPESTTNIPLLAPPLIIIK